MFPESFTPELREQAVKYTFAFGEQLRKEGYRGYFELDFLIDMDGKTSNSNSTPENSSR